MYLAVIPFPRLDPVLFQLGPLEIRWYALAYIGGLLFATWYMKRLTSTPPLWGTLGPPMTRAQIDDFFLWSALGVVVGGRIGYVAFYQPKFFIDHPLEIVKMWDGGMSFHGGFLGVLVASVAFAQLHRVSLVRMLDLGSTAVPVGLGLGRLANFINGELWGRPTNVPWAMIFPLDDSQLPRHPSQLYEAVFEGLILFSVLRIATHRCGALQHPGRTAGLFAIGYGLSRIILEMWREPDDFMGYFVGFLTMGQILSLPLVAFGIWMIWWPRLNTMDDSSPPKDSDG